MSSTQDDGGPAFPIPNDPSPGAYEAHPGMGLRDYFATTLDVSGYTIPGGPAAAAEVLGILPPASDEFKDLLDFSFRAMAVLRYRAADAMLAARKR